MRSLLDSLILKRMALAQAALALGLSLALLTVLVPFDALSSSKLCSMPCCAGKAPHLAGSCSGGHCHATLSIAKKEAEPEHQHCASNDSPARPQQEMHMHGEQEMLAVAEEAHTHLSVEVEETGGDAASGEAQDSAAQTASSNPEQTASVEPAVLSRPCAPDCGVSTNGFAQLRRSRDSATLSTAGHARPPTLIKFSARSYSPSLKTSLLCRRCVPRGPPVAFS